MPNIFTNEQQKGSKTKSSGRQNAHQNFDVFTSNPIISGSLDTTNENNRGTTMDTSLPRNTYYYQGAIATVSIQGYTPGVLAEKLLKQYGIYTVAIVHPKVNGVRITPHLSSTVEDCYRLNKALSELAK
jgi:7-keto-8-aminopelargonate synthetase-like enzyme